MEPKPRRLGPGPRFRSAVPEAPLAQACRELGELRGVLANVAAGRAAAVAAHEEENSAAVALSGRGRTATTRRRDLDDARRAHVVAGLRPHLAIGEACPVCEQAVGTLPAPVHAPELAAAQERLQEADRALASAQKLAQRLGRQRPRPTPSWPRSWTASPPSSIPCPDAPSRCPERDAADGARGRDGRDHHGCQYLSGWPCRRATRGRIAASLVAGATRPGHRSRASAGRTPGCG